MPGKQRHYEIWIGNQGSGKTHQLRRRARLLAANSRVDCVLICDRLNEWGDFERLQARVYNHYADFVGDMGEGIPRVAIFQLGVDADAYDLVLLWAVRQGNCAVLLDEAYAFAPSGSTWRGSDVLQRIVFSGRHLSNEIGEECVTHLLIGAQYARTMDHSLWEQARVIMCGRVEGKTQEQWIRENFGEEKWASVKRLGEHEWTALRGSRPALGANRW